MSLNSQTLVLNKNWLPIAMTSAMKAMCKLYAGTARAIDPVSFTMYDFYGWVQNGQSKQLVKSSSISVPVPEVIVLVAYKGKPVSDIPFTRTNIFKRDQHKCQYCGKTQGRSGITIDHVLPKSKGGKNTWENCVASCSACNAKKGNKTLKQAGMTLLKKPKKPSWAHQLYVQAVGVNDSWSNFIDSFS